MHRVFLQGLFVCMRRFRALLSVIRKLAAGFFCPALSHLSVSFFKFKGGSSR
jgi:hypothetical protein